MNPRPTPVSWRTRPFRFTFHPNRPHARTPHTPEKAEFPYPEVTYGGLVKGALHVTVYDKDVMSSDDLIGQVYLPLADFSGLLGDEGARKEESKLARRLQRRLEERD